MKLPSLYDNFADRWSKCNSIWIISDTHFGETVEESGLFNKPSDEDFIQKINSKVGRNDILIHLGDVGDIECARALKGYKVLVMGNHDAGASKYKRRLVTKRFEVRTKQEALSAMRALYPNWRIVDVREHYQFIEPFYSWEVTADNGLFDEVYEGPVTIGEKLILSHEPIPSCSWAANLHGHVHSAEPDSFNFCSLALGYEPYSFSKWLKENSLNKITSLHRTTIDKASKKKKEKT